MSPREEEIIQHLIDVLIDQLDPDKIYLFGSRAVETHRHGSDFDVAVDLPRPDMIVERAIKDALEHIVGLYSYDIAYLKTADPDFRELVLAKGKVIYEKKMKSILRWPILFKR